MASLAICKPVGAGSKLLSSRVTTPKSLRNFPNMRQSVVRSNPRIVCTSSAVTTKAVVEVSEETFEEEVLQSDQVVLVDYWATWCGPCKLVAPLMEWCAKEYPELKVVKVETDPNKGLVQKYNVRCLLAV
eukprot:CAMPEP_0177626692 /NCGR_PEP_ID=MMETSP0419_2-20121207/30792_1 /TAXON_ID=582737 /ORGANISM="Tetraselmis sp., Strain GSL018" /LENGTH=129 /DNA_ID=CAMNT_0019127769 /DNA_START=143 /DNA_END=532 /DNA_ORIENTATION=+